jgi:methylase of polypeptide subunit release factors
VIDAAAQLAWEEDGAPRSARWQSEAGLPPPAQVNLADDRMPADTAWRLVQQGTALLWRGDYQNARHLLQALARRADRPPRRMDARRGTAIGTGAGQPPVPAAGQAFALHRQAQGRRAAALGRLLVPLEGDWRIALKRAPDLRAAFTEAWGPGDGQGCVVSLRELLGLVGAHEWRKKGVEVPALGPPPGNRIHPHYGVFSPVRGEYLDLIAQAPLPRTATAFDIGTGTGVIAAVLARRGLARVVATETDPRALACAADNLERLGMQDRVTLLQADLFPPGTAGLVVCNPPWLPAVPSAPVERAVYDEDSRMLRGFLGGLRACLAPGGEGWLVLSDFAELLGLRAPGEVEALIAAGGLKVLGRLEARPRHPKAVDPGDPLHAARARERTSLWRLGAA